MMTFQEKMERVRLYVYAGNFFMVGGVSLWYGIKGIVTQHEQGSSYCGTFDYYIIRSVPYFDRSSHYS